MMLCFISDLVLYSWWWAPSQSMMANSLFTSYLRSFPYWQALSPTAFTIIPSVSQNLTTHNICASSQKSQDVMLSTPTSPTLTFPWSSEWFLCFYELIISYIMSELPVKYYSTHGWRQRSRSSTQSSTTTSSWSLHKQAQAKPRVLLSLPRDTTVLNPSRIHNWRQEDRSSPATKDSRYLTSKTSCLGVRLLQLWDCS